MLDLNEIIKKDSKLNLDFSIPNEGSIMFLTNTNQNFNIKKDTMFYINGYNNLDDYKVFTDTAGSYHFWMTLPYNNSQSEENIMINHQKACYLLQTIEPLLVAIYGSPDPRYQSTKSKVKYFAGSYRGAVNRHANYGSSQVHKYKTDLYTRITNSSRISKPTSINSHHYITKIRDNYKNKKEKNDTKKKTKIIDEDKFANNSNSNSNNSINTEKTPNYLFFNKEWNKFDNNKEYNFNLFNIMNEGLTNLKQPEIGLNIRRKGDIKGFEFRIMDHLPEEEVYDVFKIILLISCLSYEIDHKHLILASTNNGWNDVMANALMYGSMKEVNIDYLTLIGSQFKISADIFSNKDPIKVLETLINEIWKIISKNKSNGYWLMCDDKKPIVKSKNKEILDKLLHKNFLKKSLDKTTKTKKTKKIKKTKTKSSKTKNN
jgi:hypothetical protein